MFTLHQGNHFQDVFVSPIWLPSSKIAQKRISGPLASWWSLAQCLWLVEPRASLSHWYIWDRTQFGHECVQGGEPVWSLDIEFLGAALRWKGRVNIDYCRSYVKCEYVSIHNVNRRMPHKKIFANNHNARWYQMHFVCSILTQDAHSTRILRRIGSDANCFNVETSGVLLSWAKCRPWPCSPCGQWALLLLQWTPGSWENSK